MTEINGEVSQGYEAVAEAFSNNFEQFEETGAAFCLYVEGKSVVDIWGGVADVLKKFWRCVWGKQKKRNTEEIH